MTSSDSRLASMLIVGADSNNRLSQAKKIAPSAIETDPTGVEEIRQLRRIINLGQSVIIRDAENLTPEAQNALLKTLEEPPEGTTIILLAPSADLLLPTVVSRCVISDLGNLSNLEIAPQEQKKLEKVLDWVGESDLKNGFAWAKEITDRQNAIATIDKLLLVSHQNPNPEIIRKLFQAKKYLKASTNVRLTLENLFLN